MAADLEGKVVIVTGASSGIGRATAIKLSKLGALLALTGRRENALNETLEQCGQGHMTALFDVRDGDATDHFIQNVMHKFGKIDHVFNNAGVNPKAVPIASMGNDDLNIMIDTNIKGMINVTRAALPHLQNGACFVNHSSISGLHPAPNIGLYCATKYAIIGFSKCMALELGPRGIRTNVIAPGYIDTPTNISVLEGAESMKRAGAATAMGRMGTPEEVADVVAFLFSDGSRYMNGSVVEINGGTG